MTTSTDMQETDAPQEPEGELMVSVGILTYNHAAYLSEGLQSVFGQQAPFRFEVVVGDDCSEDDTLDILKRFEEQFPGRLTVLTTETRLGVYENGKRVLERCKGKYVAMMDGDDKWLYDGKLRRQVAELEAAPDCAGCFHDALIHTDRSMPEAVDGFDYAWYRTYSQFNLYSRKFYPWDVVERNIIPTSSLVFRYNERMLKETSEFADLHRSLDWIYHLLLIQDGYFLYINEQWSMYNNHAGGITKTISRERFIRTIIAGLKRIRRHAYYRNIVHHVYSSLAREHLNLFFVENGISRMKRMELVGRHFFYGLLSLIFRCIGLISMVFQKTNGKQRPEIGQ